MCEPGVVGTLEIPSISAISGFPRRIFSYFSLVKSMPVVPCIPDATNKPQAPPAVFFNLMLKMRLVTKLTISSEIKKNNTPCSSAANSKEKTWPPQHLADT